MTASDSLWQKITNRLLFPTQTASSVFHHVTRTVPIISRCSCLPKSMALPLKNHLKVGSRDGSQDTSQGSTRLWPTSASRLSGGAVILVGSKGIRGGTGSSEWGCVRRHSRSHLYHRLVHGSRIASVLTFSYDELMSFGPLQSTVTLKYRRLENAFRSRGNLLVRRCSGGRIGEELQPGWKAKKPGSESAPHSLCN